MEEKINWWKNSAIYQIYPLSFNDSNNDGIGDINGIREKLDYLKNLGVDVIWFSPIYESPMVDNGYDISDYYKINPIFGTIEDFKNLLNEVHEKGMRLIMDLVVNHTSNEHVWFKEALSNPNSKYRDYYIWRDKPSDINSVFSGPAWTFDKMSNQYYFHLFAKEQPDLNWQNEDLRKEIYQMINYWLDFGIDGFRLDVIDLIGKNIDNKQVADGPFLEKHLKEMYDNCFRDRDVMTVGETPALSVDRAKELTTYPKNYLDMVFQFSHIALDEVKGKSKWHKKMLDLVELKELFQSIQNTFKTSGWTSLFWSNHDQPRAVSRYGDENYNYESATMLMTVLYGLKGTPFIYQGEELGMTGIKFDSINQYKDVESINMYNEYLNLGYDEKWILDALHTKSRDNSRTPMQWDNSKYAGFSKVKPWIEVNENYKNINAQNQLNDKNSVYNYFKKFFELRKNYQTFIDAEAKFVEIKSKNIFAYQRLYKNKNILIIGNFNNKPNELTIDIENYTLLLTNYENKKIKNILPPYWVGVFMEELNDDN